MKTRTAKTLLTCLILVLILPACQPAVEYDIRGVWQYTMTDSNGNIYDTGAITFSGSPARGTYLQINIYEIEYEGEYTVKGSDLSLTGSETWQGAFLDARQINGNWQHENGDNGTFIATQQNP